MVFSLIRVVTKEWSNDIEKVLTPLESLTLFLGSYKNIEYLVLSIRGSTPFTTVQNALDCEKTLTSAEHDPQTVRPNGLMTVYSAACTM